LAAQLTNNLVPHLGVQPAIKTRAFYVPFFLAHQEHFHSLHHYLSSVFFT